MPELSPVAAEVEQQFDHLEQQREAARLGMWAFLASEVLLFGALFTAYTVYRSAYPAAFTEASRHLWLSIGAVNTALLLVSSVTMSLAILAAEAGRRRAVALLLLATALIGLLFLGLKGVEYWLDYRGGIVPGARFHEARFADPGPSALFFVLYFALTGAHVLHLLAGILLVLGLLVLHARGRLKPQQVELGGLYWHFVDVVWIVVFTSFYLGHPS